MVASVVTLSQLIFTSCEHDDSGCQLLRPAPNFFQESSLEWRPCASSTQWQVDLGSSAALIHKPQAVTSCGSGPVKPGAQQDMMPPAAMGRLAHCGVHVLVTMCLLIVCVRPVRWCVVLWLCSASTAVCYPHRHTWDGGVAGDADC